MNSRLMKLRDCITIMILAQQRTCLIEYVDDTAVHPFTALGCPFRKQRVEIGHGEIGRYVLLLYASLI